MILKSIKLENIRSYVNQEIKFPLGSVLLEGNIGSGKSSVLQAIEFALFGLRRDMGNSLLRNGVTKGSVELDFSINDKDINIKRVLKRAKDSVSQDSGHIIINKEKRELTTVEQRQMIFSLLKYPEDLLTKSKDLIYRYTVYTPQEEMKHILLTDRETRLNILRRVFGIDRYKRINENAEIYLSHLKERKNHNSSLIIDLDEKIDKKDKKEIDIRNLDKKITELMPKLNVIKKDIENGRNKIKIYEEKIILFNGLKKDLELKELELKNKLGQRKQNQENIEELEIYIKQLKNDIKEDKLFDKGELKKLIDSKNYEIKLMEDTIKEIITKIKENEIKRNVSEDVKKKISILDLCPLCKQEVSKDHKHNINETEDKNQKLFNDNIKIFKEREKEAESKLKSLKEDVERLRKEESGLDLLRLKVNSLKEREEKKIKLNNMNENIKKEIGVVNVEKERIQKEIDNLKNIEKEYKIYKEELEELKNKEKKLEMESYGYQKELEGIKREYDLLLKDIQEKIKFKEELVKINKLKDWIEDHFINLMELIEKQIMAKVHNDFSSLFEKWFNILMDNDEIEVKLDSELTPIIEQNGHDIEYEYLSGGEKTAAALAYRLSLNQVINDVSNIRTKEMIILDEPTDGFSSEQLDKMRYVLEELKMKQIIIVSHDPKIESFVDNIIRLDKKGHVTSIL